MCRLSRLLVAVGVALSVTVAALVGAAPPVGDRAKPREVARVAEPLGIDFGHGSFASLASDFLSGRTPGSAARSVARTLGGGKCLPAGAAFAAEADPRPLIRGYFATKPGNDSRTGPEVAMLATVTTLSVVGR